MADPIIYTYADAVDHLITASGGAAQDAEQKDIRLAIANAYRDLTSETDWQWFHKLHRVQLAAPYATGTIQYTHSTRTVALSSGTFPSAMTSDTAKYYRIIINNDVCKVASYTNSTTIVLDSVLNP